MPFFLKMLGEYFLCVKTEFILSKISEIQKAGQYLKLKLMIIYYQKQSLS